MGVLVACPDARQPAYEAVAGLAAVGRLDRFVTGFYSSVSGLACALPHVLPDELGTKLRLRLARRRHDAIPDARVISVPAYDAALALENQARSATTRRRLGQWRTRHFDRALAAIIRKRRPEAVLLFSDVGSEFALACCRRLGIPAILSMVHGDTAEERELIKSEQARSPSYFPLYLGDGEIDRAMLAWLHQRRADDARLASMLLVPSEHIAARLVARGVSTEKIRIVPYAADCQRFLAPEKLASPGCCTFLFAGGITQRKGISDLFDAWSQVAQSGWTLQLVGGLPRQLGPLKAELQRPGVVWLGRVSHAEMPRCFSQADVFVFPSLFEGSAVVTYEAMACGLPSIVTRESGTLARDGLEGLIVPAADPGALAHAMRRLGEDPELRADFGRRARQRALEHDWPRYHRAVAEAVDEAAEKQPGVA
jgi:hypothetical protein